MNARSEPHGREEALSLARRARTLVAAKGAKVTERKLTTKTPDDEILSLVLGPSGNLRAPAFFVGKTLYVGFPKGGFPGLR